MRSLDWKNQKEKDAYLLRGEDLKLAEEWLEKWKEKWKEKLEEITKSIPENENNPENKNRKLSIPEPTNLHRNYINKSREVEDANNQAILNLKKAKEDAEKQIEEAQDTKKKLILSGSIIFGITLLATIATIVLANNASVRAKASEDTAKKFETQFNSSKAQAQKAEEDRKKVLEEKEKIERQIKIIRKQSTILEKNKKQAEAQRKVAEAKVKKADIQLQLATRHGELATQQANDATQTAEQAKRDQAQAILARNEAQKAVNIAKQKENALLVRSRQLQYEQNRLTQRNKEIQNNLINTKIQTTVIEAKFLWRENPHTLDSLLVALKAGGQLQKRLRLSTDVSTEIQQQIKKVLQQAQQTVQERSQFAGHKGSIITASYSPNGRVLATSSEDTTIILWDALTRKKLHTLTNHDRFVNSISFSSDGKVLASGSSDGKIILWNVETGDKLETQKILKPFKDKQRVISISFSPDGKTFAAASDGGDIILWEWTKRELKDLLTLPGNGYGINSISFSPDGRDLASAQNGGIITIWNWDKTTKNTNNTTLPFYFKGDAFRVAFSPNSKDKLLAMADTNGNVILWDF